MENKYKIGDKVTIVNYGHLMWINTKLMQTDYYEKMTALKEDGYFKWYDMQPELVGKKGVVNKVTNTQNKPKYGLSGIAGKSAWYDEEQLELIK